MSSLYPRLVICTAVIYSPIRIYMDMGPEKEDSFLHKCVWKHEDFGIVTELIHVNNLKDVQLPF